MGNIKSKFKDKKFIKTLLIFLAIFIVVIILLNWLVKSGENGRQKSNADSFSDYYKGLMARCQRQDEKLYDCCFASVERMALGNLELAPGMGCQPGFKINTYRCLGSYKWCEMIR